MRKNKSLVSSELTEKPIVDIIVIVESKQRNCFLLFLHLLLSLNLMTLVQSKTCLNPIVFKIYSLYIFIPVYFYIDVSDFFFKLL